MGKSITESSKKILKLFDTSIFICLAQNWLPEIAHYVFVSNWNNKKYYGINFKSHWSKFNNKSRPRVEQRHKYH